MKRMITGMVLLGLLIVLPACSKNEPANTQGSGESPMVSNTAQEAGKSPLENLLIDENVDTTAGYKSALPALTVKYKPFDAEKVLAALIPGASIKDMKITPCVFGNGMKYDDFSRNTKGSYISIGYQISYQTSKGEFYVKYSPYANSDRVFIKNGELPFESRDKALENVKSILSQAGIENVSLKEAYAMDYQTLGRMEQEYSQGEGFEDELQAGREIYKGNWSKEDDCYFFVLRQELNGIPVYEDNYLMSEKEIINGTEMLVYYTKNGIEALSTNVVYEDVSSQDESAVLSAQEALKLIDAKYSDIILLSDVTITRMELMYVPTSSEETTQMIPVWRFTLVQDVTWESDDGMRTDQIECDYYFNAIDGKEILCTQ